MRDSLREFWQLLRKSVSPVWLGVWALMYVAFLMLDFFFDDMIAITVLKYGGLVICLFYVLMNARADVFLVVALCFTLIADGLLIKDNVSLIGVGFFVLVQATHLLRLTRIRNVSPLPFLGIAAVILVLGLIQEKIPNLFVLATIYGFLLGVNIFQASRWYLESRGFLARMAVIGLILLALCDICVAVSYLTISATLPGLPHIIANYLAWFFYFPSQVMLALSGKTARLEKKAELTD